MAVAIAEADDLVLDRRAIARAAALDLAGIHRRAMHIGPDHLMGRRRGPGDAALDLRRGDPLGHHRKRLRRIVAGLHLHRGPVDGRAVEPRRRAGLQPPEGEAGALEGSREPDRRRLADPARRPILLAEMDQPAQEGPGGDDHRAGGNSRPSARPMPVTRPSATISSSASPSITLRFAVSAIAACIAAA